MNKKRIAFHTLGCKLNFAETSSLANELDESYTVVDFGESADVYVIQTCVVTATAEKKCRSGIRQASQRNPGAIIAVLGCMSQLRSSSLAAMPEVSLILGNAEKHQLAKFLQHTELKPSNQIIVSDILKPINFRHAFSADDRTRVFIKIQDGCDYFCSYCAVPFARGGSRSDNIANTLETLQKAIEQENPKEVVLTGVNIGDFGKPHGERFIDLLNVMENVTQVDRYRLSSVEPDLMSDEIICFVAGSQRFMPHFHLPLQSGTDTVLKRMHRRYTIDSFRSHVLKIKELMPFACIAVDVIAGFPGETDQEFEESFSLLEQLPVSYLHVFPYSERSGTLASKMIDKVHNQVITNRTHRLLTLSDRKKKEFYDINKMRTERVLFESESKNSFMYGFTRNYIRVKTVYDKRLVNQIISVVLDNQDNNGVYIHHHTT